MAGKFQIRSRKWDIGILIACLASLALGFGGLFLLHSMGNSTGTTTNLFVILLGVLTFAAFAGPGIVYVLRKRVKKIKDRLPGGTMTWIRSHLYIPVLALILGLVHATVVPFRDHLSSGKVLLALGVLVAIAGLARHHLIGVQKAALNVNVAIGKLTTGQPRAFRRLVADYTDHRRTRAEVDAAVAQMDPSVQGTWAKIRELSDEVEKHFPREGGQSWGIRQYKLWRAIHAPLTIALFVVLAFHVWDVFGGTRAVAGEGEQFATAEECAACHSQTFEEWAGSTMAHALTSTINEGQLPITLSENVRIIEEFDGSQSLTLLTGRDLEEDSQQQLIEDNAQICIDCHGPVGGSLTEDPLALLPFGEAPSEVDGNAAVTSDGVGCIVCHTIETPPDERQGNAALVGGAVQAEASGGGYPTMYGPLFTDPNPLPVRIHGVDTPDGLWGEEADPEAELETSQLCGACHNVKLDIDLDGLSGVEDSEEQGILDIIDDADELDPDGDFTLDENELDDNRVQTEARPADQFQDDGGDGLIDDLVLQTTYDEWQDYVAYFEAEGGFTDRYAEAEFPNELDSPLGCQSCHMPLGEVDQEPVIDDAPGFLPEPDRFRRQHTFVGVDYDLDAELYFKNGLSEEDIAFIVAERNALVRSAATVEVVNGDAFEFNGGQAFEATVTVRNNLLAHAFPTGFAFARQFWLEVSAETADGDEVCLVPAFFDDTGAALGNTPCGSGFADPEGTEPVEGDAELLQCDTRAFAEEALGVDPDTMLEFALQQNPTPPDGVGIDENTGIALPNLNIDFAGTDETDFAGSFGPDECDPWLANFQKILTDGNPDGDNVREEVPYQPVLPDAVKIRGQVASNTQMAELQPVRLREINGELVDASFVDVPYIFALPEGVDPTQVVVTARLRFRHLPPYFIQDLENRQEQLGDEVPPGARLDADEMLTHMVVADLVEAQSDEGEQLGCEGPQNEARTIHDCIDEDEVDELLEELAFGDGGGGGGDSDDREGFDRGGDDEDEEGLADPSGFVSMMLPGLVLPAAWWRRRLRSKLPFDS